jgi:hypothetical protein
MKNVFEKVFLRLLKESAFQANGLAVHLHKSNTVSVLYDPTDLILNYKEILDIEQRARFFEDYGVADIIKGIIAIRKPRNPCRGAWQVDYVAGPGYGHILYPLGHAMSPTGLLTPDRHQVSDEAGQAWEKSIKKFSRVGLPFDDITAHAHSPMRPHPHHTDDPFDDCIVHNNPHREFLDYAYPPLGGENELLEDLISNHIQAMKKIPASLVNKIEEILREEGDIFADKHINTADLEA